MTEFNECREVLDRAHLFLDGELTEDEADAMREHLLACEHCLDHVDAEQTIRALIRRCCEAERAPETLRVRVVSAIQETFGTTVEVHSVEIRHTFG